MWSSTYDVAVVVLELATAKSTAGVLLTKAPLGYTECQCLFQSALFVGRFSHLMVASMVLGSMVELAVVLVLCAATKLASIATATVDLTNIFTVGELIC